MPKRADTNQAEIVKALREIPGVTVQDLHEVGRGCPDILVGHRSTAGSYVNILMEIKTAAGKLNAAEADWHARWRGQVCVVRSVDEALRAIGVLK